MAAPTAPNLRPAQGFTTARAQSWVLGSALLTALIYGFRRATGDTTPSSTTSTKGQSLAGVGQPAPLSHWAIAYGAGYLMLAVLALGAPELAASLAAMAVMGNVITNGLSLTSDIQALETSDTPAADAVQAHPSAKQVARNDAKAPGLAKSLIPLPAPYPTGAGS